MPTNQPELYHQYSRPAAIASVGRDGASSIPRGRDWHIFPHAILCFCEVGNEQARRSHFSSGSRFHWVADQRSRVDEGPYGFLPSEVEGGRQDARPILLFVRPIETTEYTFVGRLTPCYAYGFDGDHPFGIADFTLTPTLPNAVWRNLGDLIVPADDYGDIDRLIQSLAEPLSVQDRLSVLERLIAYWHGPCRPEDGYSDEELAGVALPLPLPLRWWYHYGGKRRGILSGQNRLLAPADLEDVDGGRLLFYVENQAVYLWATAQRGEDPAVWGKFNDGENSWVEEEVNLSGFLIQACVLEAIFSANYGASVSSAGQETLERVVAPLRPVPLGAWRWPAYPSRFFAGQGDFHLRLPKRGFARWAIPLDLGWSEDGSAAGISQRDRG